MNQIFDISFDHTNGLWSKGVTEDSADSYGFDMLVKYTKNGQRIWLSTDSLNAGGAAYKVCNDDNDNIYFASGYVMGAPSVFKFFKYDTSGNKIWQITDSASAGYNYATDITFHNSAIYLLKQYHNTHNGFCLLKYDTSGVLLSSICYQDSASDLSGLRMIISSSGHIYVCGQTNDIYIVRINNDSTLGWVRSYDCGSNQTDMLFNVVMDFYENLYLTGKGNWVSSSDLFVFLVDSSGNLQWSDLYTEPSSSWTEGNDIAVDADHNIYVAGTAYIPSAGAPVSIVRKYSFQATQIEIQKSKQNAILFPNPTHYKIYFSDLTDVEKGSFFIYDSSDKLIRSGKIKENAIDVSELPNGIYFCLIRSGSTNSCYKFVVN